MKIGITGAGGYIGSRLMYDLLKQGHDIVGIDNFFLAKIKQVSGKKIINADIRDSKKIEKLFKDCDVIHHLAAITGLVICEKDPGLAIEVNITGTQNIVDVCKKYNIALTFPASMAIFGIPQSFPIKETDPKNPVTFYGLNKLFGIKAIELFSKDNFPAHILILSNVYGNHSINDKEITKPTVINLFLNQFKKNKPLTVYKPGEQKRNFIHVKDVTDAFVLSTNKILNDKKTVKLYNVASNNHYSVNDIANLFKEKHDAKIKMIDNPRNTEIYLDRFDVDTTKIKNDFGFKCKFNVEDTISNFKI